MARQTKKQIKFEQECNELARQVWLGNIDYLANHYDPKIHGPYADTGHDFTVDCYKFDDWTLSHFAIWGGNKNNIFEALMELDNNFHAFNVVRSTTPYDLACETGQLEFVKKYYNEDYNSCDDHRIVSNAGKGMAAGFDIDGGPSWEQHIHWDIIDWVREGKIGS